MEHGNDESKIENDKPNLKLIDTTLEENTDIKQKLRQAEQKLAKLM